MERTCIHFVGFRGEEYNAAKRVWGEPDFIHRGWDRRAQREIGEADTVVFTRFAHLDVAERNYPDIIEKEE